MSATLPRRLLLVQGPRSSRSVCLTFDDGPHPEHTARLLDVLSEHNVPATFFVVGRQAESHPELVRRAVASGHEVGHHSYTHSEPSDTPASELAREVVRTRELLGQLTGHKHNLFRPPKGELTVPKLYGLWKARQTVVLWNRDPKDFAGTSTQDVAERLDRLELYGGDIILLHDNWPYAAELIPRIASLAAGRGLAFTTVGRWI